MNRDKRYMDLARTVSLWSKDPSSKLGSVAVNPDTGLVLSTGYNGFPRGIMDTEERLNDRPTKYGLVVHSEVNCIYNACYNGVKLFGSTLYVYGLPICEECGKAIIQVGIKRVVMCVPVPREIWTDRFNNKTAPMFDEAGVIWEYVEL